jgi:hypothetical protein
VAFEHPIKPGRGSAVLITLVKRCATLATVIAIQMGYVGGVAAGFVADRDVTISQKALDRVPLGFVEWFSRFIHP